MSRDNPLGLRHCYALGGNMGAKLSSFYAEAEKLGGIQMKLRLAREVRMTSAQAQSTEDTPELVGKFEQALAQVSRTGVPSAPAKDVGVPGSQDPGKLRKHIQVYLDLMSQRSLVLGDVDETIRRVNEAAAEALDCARVSVWL